MGGVNVTLNNGVADIVVANDGSATRSGASKTWSAAMAPDTLVGDDSDNLLDGGAGGNDNLTGGVGDDT